MICLKVRAMGGKRFISILALVVLIEISLMLNQQVRTLGGLLAARTGESPSVATEQLHQCLSVTLQRDSARAVLR